MKSQPTVELGVSGQHGFEGRGREERERVAVRLEELAEVSREASRGEGRLDNAQKIVALRLSQIHERSLKVHEMQKTTG